MLISRKTLHTHVRWIAAATLLSAAAIVWYGLEAMRAPKLPGGSSWPGLVFGMAAGAIMLFEIALWPRKAVRGRRLGNMKLWMRAHIWLGFLSIPLVLLHSGFTLGGSLSTVLSILFALVIASGIYGLVLQQIVPSQMLSTLPGETIHTAISEIARLQLLQAEAFVLGATGQGVTAGATRESEEIRTIGARRPSVRMIPAPPPPVAGVEPLKAAFDSEIRSYLWLGAKTKSLLCQPKARIDFFAKLRAQLPEAVHEGVVAMEACCAERFEFDRQLAFQTRLHRWLAWHLALAFLLVALMFMHIWFALQYM